MKKIQFIKGKKRQVRKKKKNPEEFNICAEKKYFIKRQNEGNIIY